MTDNVEFEITTKTVEKQYVVIGDEEFSAGRVIDVLRSAEGTDTMFRTSFIGLEGEVADVFVDRGLFRKTASGAYFSADDERVGELRDRIIAETYRSY